MSVELPLKPRQLHPTAKKQKSTANGSGSTGGKKHKGTNGLAAVARAQAQQAARNQTIANKRILIIDGRGKRRFMLLSEYEAAR